MELAHHARLPLLPDPDSFELEKILDARPPTRTSIGRWLRAWTTRNAMLIIFTALLVAIAILYVAMKVVPRPSLEPTGQPHLDDFSIRLAESDRATGEVGVDAGDVEHIEGGGEEDGEMLEVPDADIPGVDEGSGQASLQSSAAKDEPLVDIRATFYGGAEGPKACRGQVIGMIQLAKPDGPGATGPAQCYNFPNQQYSECATFLGNTADGCVARVFASPNCLDYLNTAPFTTENRAVGGHWRSVEVQCGIPEPDPAALGQPPMMDQITSMVNNDKPQGRKRSLSLRRRRMSRRLDGL